jgi:hypothetical protein
MTDGRAWHKRLSDDLAMFTTTQRLDTLSQPLVEYHGSLIYVPGEFLDINVWVVACVTQSTASSSIDYLDDSNRLLTPDVCVFYSRPTLAKTMNALRPSHMPGVRAAG